jgi:hypothetical protein
MAKTKSISTYASELKRMIKERTGADMEAWLMPQVRATASNMVILDKIQVELEGVKSFVSVVDGSTGQKKSEVSPLLPHYDKLQRTLLMQFEALGLNYSTTPSKVKEDTRKGVDEKDPMVRYYETKKT